MGKLMTKSTSYVISTFQSLCFVRTCEISISKGFRAFKRQRLNFVLITKFPILFFQKCSGHHREKWRHFGSVTFYQWQKSRAWVGGYKRFTYRISSEPAAHKKFWPIDHCQRQGRMWSARQEGELPNNTFDPEGSGAKWEMWTKSCESKGRTGFSTGKLRVTS